MPDGQAPVIRDSVCPLDCPDTCSLAVTVEDDQVVAVRGSEANPLTESVVCNKVARYYPDFVHGPTRLRHPLLRVGTRGDGRYEPISWAEAIDRVHDGIAASIERYGPESVVPFNYAGPHGMLAGGSMDLRFFHKLGASKLDRPPMCGGVKTEACVSVYGNMPGTPPEQGIESELIVVWGNNVTVSNLHFIRTINRAKSKGAKLVVIDPKRVKVAERADLHLAIRPGTDAALALALAAELERLDAVDHGFVERWTVGADELLAEARAWTVERAAAECGIDAGHIRTLARWYADAKPALISVGNGLERNQNGGNGIRAILALPALAGKWGVVGGGAVVRAGAAVPKTMAKLQRPDLAPAGTRTLNIMDVPRLILDPGAETPIGALFVYNHNPVATHPEQRLVREALSRSDLFVVGCEVQMTDSMAYADVVLPACSHFEHADLFPAYGQTYLQRADAVIPPVGEALPNTEIFRRLAARFGFEEPCFKATDIELMDDAIDGSDPRLGGIAPSALPTGAARNMSAPDGRSAIVPFATVFPTTPSGKAELASETTAARRGFRVPVYRKLDAAWPLALITPSSADRTNATFGGHEASAAMPVLEIHPDDAAARGISEGAEVRVWNDLGETRLLASVTDAVRPGVVYSPKGTWACTSSSGDTVNVLMISAKADLCEGACYNDTRVDVAAA